MKAIAVAIQQTRVMVVKTKSEPSCMKSLIESVPKLVVKTTLVEQVMKLGLTNLEKSLSRTSMSKFAKDESH